MRLLIFYVVLSVSAAVSDYGQNGSLAEPTKNESPTVRLAQLVEANVIATHAYQVLLAKKSGKGDPKCFGSGRLSDSELEALVEHQAKILKSNVPAMKEWVRGARSNFDPVQDLEPILSSGLTAPATAPISIFDDYLRKKTKFEGVKTRAIASLYQTVLEVERDGDLLQDEFAFYIALGLPVYVGQLHLPGTDAHAFRPLKPAPLSGRLLGGKSGTGVKRTCTSAMRRWSQPNCYASKT